MSRKNRPNLITVLGHTAAGKTSFAARLALLTGGEIISADSRQVYRGMDLGTGKDYEDYSVEGRTVPYHLIDIAEPGYEYNLYEFQEDFARAFRDISSRGKMPVLCGGTGLYLEAVLRDYKLTAVPVNEALRAKMEEMSMEELGSWLASLRKLHNTTDTLNRKRVIRAIEIEEYELRRGDVSRDFPSLVPVIFGIRFERELRRARITERLRQRLDKGMAGEVRKLLESGIAPGKLEFYGLEYKYLTRFVTGKITYEEMFTSLETAIHRFAKRQMTWFRKMEREGIKIHWLDGELTTGDMTVCSMKILKEYGL